MGLLRRGMSGLKKRILYSKPVSGLISFLFTHADKLVPVSRLRETQNWLAFTHPNPCYPVHILIVPKRQIANWMQLPLDDPALYAEFVALTQSMIRDFCLEDAGYRMIVNGGINQDFAHLHIHLVAGKAS
jgi:histidine triad (HIT) family protein